MHYHKALQIDPHLTPGPQCEYEGLGPTVYMSQCKHFNEDSSRFE